MKFLIIRRNLRGPPRCSKAVADFWKAIRDYELIDMGFVRFPYT